MSQNIYDTPDFFAKYIQLDRQVHGLAGAPEWPQLRSYLPEDFSGLRVLDLGCGFGWFTRWARDAGAAHAHGIDLSENMLARAHAMTPESGTEPARITYQRADLDELHLPEGESGTYDVVFSSLALHYLVHLEALVGEVHRVLRAGGRFVFSIEHPLWTAPSNPAWQKDEATGRVTWPLDDYQLEGQRITNWLADGVKKQHRTITTYINVFLKSDFDLVGFDEWCPSEEDLAAHPGWWKEKMRPSFLLMSVRKRS